MLDWSKYIEQSGNRPPRPLLVKAAELAENRGAALDLGAGALNETRYLLENGFKKVVAVEAEELGGLTDEFRENGAFESKRCAIEEYDFPKDEFDLVSAQFVLPFVKKVEIERVVGAIFGSLKNGGIFAGQFFGPKDGWKNREGISVHSKEEVLSFLSQMEMVSFREEEVDKIVASGELKHWHVFHFIARINKQSQA